MRAHGLPKKKNTVNFAFSCPAHTPPLSVCRRGRSRLRVRCIFFVHSVSRVPDDDLTRCYNWHAPPARYATVRAPFAFRPIPITPPTTVFLALPSPPPPPPVSGRSLSATSAPVRQRRRFFPRPTHGGCARARRQQRSRARRRNLRFRRSIDSAVI